MCESTSMRRAVGRNSRNGALLTDQLARMLCRAIGAYSVNPKAAEYAMPPAKGRAAWLFRPTNYRSVRNQVVTSSALLSGGKTG
jgi:hypothetical protein